MKKCIKFFFAFICVMSMLTACSDDDDSKVSLLDVNSSYSGDKLSLTYSGSTLLGKSIAFNTNDGKTATITMKGVFNASIISELFSKTSMEVYMAPGVIPGELTTIISDIELTESGEKYTFEGTDSSNSREVKYSGEVENGKLTVTLDVTMPENALAQTWNIAPIIAGDHGGANLSQPITMTWLSEKPVKIDMSWVIPSIPEGTYYDMPTDDLVKLVCGAMLSPEIAEVLQSITFLADGNIVASYKKAGEADWQTSPLNLAMWYVSNSQLYVQLNLDMIIATVEANNQSSKAAASSISLISLLSELSSLLSDGVPLVFEVEGDAASVTIDKTVLLPILILLTDETVLAMLSEMIPEDVREMANLVLEQLPEIVESTSDISATLHLVKE